MMPPLFLPFVHVSNSSYEKPPDEEASLLCPAVYRSFIRILFIVPGGRNPRSHQSYGGRGG